MTDLCDLQVMRTRIKLCGFVRACDVDDAVALGVDAIGLVFHPRSPRCIDAQQALELRRRLPSFVLAVGLFVNEPAAQMNAIAATAGLDVLQLHGDEDPALMAQLRCPVWKALRIAPQVRAVDHAAAHASVHTAARTPDGAGSALQPAPAASLGRVAAEDDVAQRLDLYRGAEFCLLDSDSAGFGGSGHAFPWERVPAGRGNRLILAGGLHAGNVGDAIRRISPFAVDASSSVQGEGPRVKDAFRMAGFVAAVHAADGSRATSPGNPPSRTPPP